MKQYTNEQISLIVQSLGSDPPRKDNGGNLIFQTVCHNHTDEYRGSYKLYYYVDTCMFHCYTACKDSYNVYELVAKCLDYTLPQQYAKVLKYINTVLGTGFDKGFTKRRVNNQDCDLIDRYLNHSVKNNKTNLPIYPPDLIKLYQPICPIEWLNEGIKSDTLRKYNICFDVTANKIIIPYYDLANNLVGIRGRTLNIEDIERGQKYMPVAIQGDLYAHPTAYVLYGLNKTVEAIRRTKRIVIFEAEKSVLKCDTFYGDNNYSVACCGSNISKYQRDLILSLGVKEVILAMDKEYHQAFTEESDHYANKILTLGNMFAPYVSTYALWDTDNLLDYKDSPCDKGKEIFEVLLKNKFEINTLEE